MKNIKVNTNVKAGQRRETDRGNGVVIPYNG